MLKILMSYGVRDALLKGLVLLLKPSKYSKKNHLQSEFHIFLSNSFVFGFDLILYMFELRHWGRQC